MHLKKLTLIFVTIFYCLPAFGELIKPNNGIEPILVVKIQLKIVVLSKRGNLHILITKDTLDHWKSLSRC